VACVMEMSQGGYIKTELLWIVSVAGECPPLCPIRAILGDKG